MAIVVKILILSCGFTTLRSYFIRLILRFCSLESMILQYQVVMILRLAILPFEFPSEYLFQDHDFNNVDHGNAFPKLYTQQYNLVLLCNRYLLEQSLSVDNLFVFVLVFKYFKVPKEYQVCLIAILQLRFKCTL